MATSRIRNGGGIRPPRNRTAKPVGNKKYRSLEVHHLSQQIAKGDWDTQTKRAVIRALRDKKLTVLEAKMLLGGNLL